MLLDRRACATGGRGGRGAGRGMLTTTTNTARTEGNGEAESGYNNAYDTSTYVVRTDADASARTEGRATDANIANADRLLNAGCLYAHFPGRGPVA